MMSFDSIVAHLRRWNEVDPFWMRGGPLKRGWLQSWWDADTLVRIREDRDGSTKSTVFMDELYATHYKEISDTCSIDVVFEKRQ